MLKKCIVIRQYTFGEVMIRLIPTHRLLLCLLLSFCVLLQSCASKEQQKPTIKVGMHIDAVLEFAVEYPLLWEKDRWLTYGSKDGEVRWTHPDHQDTLLRIKSFLLKQPLPSLERQTDQTLQDYVGMTVTLKEEVTLPAGKAIHITGQRTQGNFYSYQLSHKNRSYLIALTTAPDNIDTYNNLMDRIIYSFQIMSHSTTMD